ncbi:MAG TPA: family 78 glycoside hydrolase catalytic domain [Pseudonocardiaceae bacterium]|nr:family 78 glycoside hydrolase catalytic domain [Pseudonocardiaceae bacterium]
MTFERSPDGLGMGGPRPRVSWRLPGGALHQRAYELELTRDAGTWTSGRIECADHHLVPWPEAPLASRERVGVRVRVWTDDGEPSGWSEPASVEAALLDPADWRAVPVGCGWAEQDGTDRRPARVRREFTLDRPVVSARLYATAHGVYEAEINGTRVGDDVLSPGWTVYRSRLLYRTYDVTDRLVAGRNVIGAWLGDGWYRGRLGFEGGTRDIYGTDQSFLAQLEITHDDGSVTTIATDRTWTAAPGPILTSGLYDGETHDARIADAAGTPVRTHDRDPATLVAADWPAVRCTDEVRPVAITLRADGTHLVDFGQNLVGRLAITVTGPAGTEIGIRHAEVVVDGELATRPLRQARATDTYVLRGGGVEHWEPRFTIHGFRYAELTGWPGVLTADAVVARVYHTDMPPLGTFECDNPLVNRLHDNVRWSMRGNFVGLPTDCPARDERLGWTGDMQVFASTAAFLYDCTALVDSWLVDVGAEQFADGTVPWYVPVVPGGPMWTPIRPGAAWGDVVTLTPWELYRSTGDVEVLRRHHGSAKAWVDLVDRLAGPDHLWDSGFQLGDWLDPGAPPDRPEAAATDPHLIATGYFAWSAHHLALAADVLDEPDEAARYDALAADVRSAFRRRYALGDGRLTSDSPTGYVVAIMFDLLDDPAPAGHRLAELVADNDYRIATGFVGTPLICDALTATGHVDVAYRLLMQTECPSWLYPVTRGATTIWERWDALRPDGSLNPGGMTSFNHFALGAVADWLYRVVAGVAPAAPGYRRITFHPRPGGGLTSAAASHETPYGTAGIAWRFVDDDMLVDLVVPPGCAADVLLPGVEPYEIGPGPHHAVVPRPVVSLLADTQP